MIEDTDKSLSSKVEVIEDLLPMRAWGRHSSWLDGAIDKIKEEFDNNEDLNLNDRLRILQAVSTYVNDLSKNPMVLIRAVQQMPEHKAKIAMGMLEKHNLIASVKKEKKISTWS